MDPDRATGRRSAARNGSGRARRGLATSLVALCAAGMLPACAEQPDFSGLWILDGFAKFSEPQLTETGRALMAGYDILEDDPSLRCEPASVARVWGNPQVEIALQQTDDEITIAYEFLDLRRRIPVGIGVAMPGGPSTTNLNGTAFRKMGSSRGRYDDDRLVIETGNYEAGYVRTRNGVPQSENTTSVEEIWLDGEALRVRQTYTDETLFQAPLVIDYRFVRVGKEGQEVPLYECTDSDYDWFEQLNQPDGGNE